MLFNQLGARVLALTLLVLGGGADHHYPAVATDHPAFLTHFLDRGTHLHWVWLSIFPNGNTTMLVNLKLLRYSM